VWLLALILVAYFAIFAIACANGRSMAAPAPKSRAKIIPFERGSRIHLASRKIS